MEAWINYFTHWVTLHPHLTGFLVGLIACAESLALVGLLVPGAVVMFTAGALIAVNAADFWTVFAWAIGGAIIGDGLSYWLGYRFGDQVHKWKLVRRHADLLDRGKKFFQRHGGKSVVFARFVGPVRPIIPVIAGMLKMPPRYFYLFNVLSAPAWAALYLVVGMGVGASIVIAGQVATRMVLLVTLIVVFVWAILWISKVIYRAVEPHLNQWGQAILTWSRRHPRPGWLAAGLLDPDKHPGRALLSWFVVLAVSTWLFLGILEDVVSREEVVRAGQSVYNLLQSLRVPSIDSVMIVFTELGDATVSVALVMVVLAWFAWHRSWRDAAYWLTAVVSGEAMVLVVKLILKMPRPISLYSGPDSYSFPSGHSTFSVVVYGFLAVLIAPAFRQSWRWLPYAIAGILVSGIGFSRIYLGAHWLADVIAGLALGTIWVAVLAIAREQRGHKLKSGYPFVIWVAAVFVLAGGWHIYSQYHVDQQRYAIREPIRKLAEDEWWTKDWASLPAYRIDLSGEREQPMNIQWAGSLNTIRRYLLSHGWRKPEPPSVRNLVLYLSPRARLDSLPVLPQLHKGQYETVLLVHPVRGTNKKQMILRLWPADTTLLPSSTPLWIGTISRLTLHRLPMVSFPMQSRHFNEDLGSILDGIPGPDRKTVHRTSLRDDKEQNTKSHTLLLIR